MPQCSARRSTRTARRSMGCVGGKLRGGSFREVPDQLCRGRLLLKLLAMVAEFESDLPSTQCEQLTRDHRIREQPTDQVALMFGQLPGALTTVTVAQLCAHRVDATLPVLRSGRQVCRAAP